VTMVKSIKLLTWLIAGGACTEQAGSAAEKYQALLAHHTPTKLSYFLDGYDGMDASDMAAETWNRYRAGMVGCDWSKIDAIAQLSRSPIGTQTPEAIGIERCHFDDEDGSHWVTARCGPFTAVPGDWHSMLAKDVFEMVALLPRGDIYSTALLSVAVDARDFSMVGYPPYHDHHSGITITGAYDFDQLLLNHQDNNCVASDGKPGELCGLVVMPPGHAIKLNSPVEFESMYEIVKDVKSTAASYANFSIEVAMRYDFKPLPTLNVWKVFSAAGNREGAFGTWRLPNAPSVLWTCSTPPISGKLLNIWIHAHSTFGMDEIWMISASAHALGLTTPDFKYPGAGFASDCSDDIEAIRNGILDHMAAHDYRFRCTARLAPYDHYFGDRQPVWRCYEGGEILEPGTFITGVFFYTNQPAGSKEAYFNNHNHYQGYVTTKEDRNFETFVTYADSMDAGCSYLDEPSFDILEWAGIRASNPHRHEIPGSVRASVPAHNVHRQVAAGLLVSLLAFAFTLWKRRTREMLL